MKHAAQAHVLMRLAAELAAGDARPRSLDVASSWTGAAFFLAVEQVLAARRPALARALLASGPRALRDPAAVAWAEARAALDEGDAAGATRARLQLSGDRAALIDARLAIDAGDPARGAAIARTLEPSIERSVVLADACAVQGDRDGARGLLATLAPRHLAALARSSRPSALIAAELQTRTSSPYR